MARANVFADLHAKYFEISRPEEVPLPSSPDQPWAAIMEIAYPQSTLTTVAFSDGTARVLRSTGGGFFAAGVVEPMRPAAKSFVREARQAQREFTATTEFPQPDVGDVISTRAVMRALSRLRPLSSNSAVAHTSFRRFTLQACASCMSFYSYRKPVSSNETPNQSLEPTAGRCDVHV
jgi:hypothetical protein